MLPSGSPMYTCSGKKAFITPGDVVHMLDKQEYRVLRINPLSDTFVLRRVLRRPTYLYAPFHSHLLASSADSRGRSLWRRTNWKLLYEIPPPPVLPDASTSCNLELDVCVSYKQPEFDSVARLQQVFEEAKPAAHAAFKELCEEISQTYSQRTNN